MKEDQLQNLKHSKAFQKFRGSFPTFDPLTSLSSSEITAIASVRVHIYFIILARFIKYI